jgi:hypothetical protein
MVSIEKEVSMGEKYVPKVGDKVRATIGDDAMVVKGRVKDVTSAGCKLHVGQLPDFWCWHEDPWHFEQIVSVPTKFGAVIRRAKDGKVFSFTAPMQKPCPWLGRDGWCDENAATAGGFTIEFDGVDE